FEVFTLAERRRCWVLQHLGSVVGEGLLYPGGQFAPPTIVQRRQPITERVVLQAGALALQLAGLHRPLQETPHARRVGLELVRRPEGEDLAPRQLRAGLGQHLPQHRVQRPRRLLLEVACYEIKMRYYPGTSEPPKPKAPTTGPVAGALGLCR